MFNVTKMTNKEVDSESVSDPRIAALLAVHLVSQILDEAYLIADAALESGQPWRYLSALKNNENDTLCEPGDENISFVASKGDSVGVNENKILEHDANIVATSTPQKVSGNDFDIEKPESSYIGHGHGDEDFEGDQDESSKSTSMLINNLFDMSEVEKVIMCDDTAMIQSNPDPTDLVGQAMAKIVDSFVNAALENVFDQQGLPAEKCPSAEESNYSFLGDAFTTDTAKDIAFYIHDGENIVTDSGDASHFSPNVEITEIYEVKDKEVMDKNDVAQFENAYLTLNRDYEQCSEDDADPILQDPKGMTLQEVELLTAHTSEENLIVDQETEQIEKDNEKSRDLAATSGVSAASGSKKSTLVGRCRSQGARLLACLRGWWRRRTPGKRKENRIPIAAHGLCPLSPDARRRASSLLDQRMLRSPSPTRGVVWKFNTVNETVVQSSRWKEYSFDNTPDNCGEF